MDARGVATSMSPHIVTAMWRRETSLMMAQTWSLSIWIGLTRPLMRVTALRICGSIV